jgi:uncharacterized protein YciI
MKRIIAIFLVISIINQPVFSQKDSTSKMPDPQIRQYWFVLLTKGNTRSQDSATAAKIQIDHLNNIRRLYMEGKIKVAGPFGEEGDPIAADWQGIFIFDCPTKQEVEKLLQTDPAIAAGRMVYHIKPWYTVPIGSFEPGKPKAPLF